MISNITIENHLRNSIGNTAMTEINILIHQEKPTLIFALITITTLIHHVQAVLFAIGLQIQGEMGRTGAIDLDLGRPMITIGTYPRTTAGREVH